MLTRRELEDEIAEYESSPTTYRNCATLAMLYSIYDHNYSNDAPRTTAERIVGSYGDTAFLSAIQGLDPAKVWAVMNELMQTLQLIQPKLHDTVMQKIKNI